MRQRPTSRALTAATLACALSLTSGCLYRMDIKQGNLLDPPQVVQLQNGMTKSQVKFLLGTPMVPNGFDSDRWNYYYYEKIGTRKPATMRVTVWFKDDKVERFERPANTEGAAAAMAESNAKAAAEAAATSAAPPAAPPRIRANPATTTPTPQPRH
ncbi:MAG: outer membrane protein assembly factor BamE [Pseudomonadota bacterium]